jgi:broad specificity phosphatase PhoE
VTKLILIRHGHVEGIKPERFRGRRDIPLTERGHAQAEAVARRIVRSWRPSHVYTSPLTRCVSTAESIARACGAPTTVLGTLNDIHYGIWEFASHEDLQRADPALFSAWFATPHLVRFPDGESLQDVAARAADFLRFFIARHGDATVVAVAHDSVNRIVLLQLLDMPLSCYWRLAQEPCCINEIDIAHDRVVVRRINETCHLGSVGTD